MSTYPELRCSGPIVWWSDANPGSPFGINKVKQKNKPHGWFSGLHHFSALAHSIYVSECTCGMHDKRKTNAKKKNLTQDCACWPILFTMCDEKELMGFFRVTFCAFHILQAPVTWTPNCDAVNFSVLHNRKSGPQLKQSQGAQTLWVGSNPQWWYLWNVWMLKLCTCGGILGEWNLLGVQWCRAPNPWPWICNSRVLVHAQLTGHHKPRKTVWEASVLPPEVWWTE